MVLVREMTAFLVSFVRRQLLLSRICGYSAAVTLTLHLGSRCLRIIPSVPAVPWPSRAGVCRVASGWLISVQLNRPFPGLSLALLGDDSAAV